nr:hypothetical protein [Tanacetum cinerariifolium]
MKKRSCLRHHLQSPTLLSTPILNRVEYFGDPTRSYLTEVLAVNYTFVYTNSEPGRVFGEPTRSYHTEDLQDEHVLSAEEQPLPPFVSPIAESPEYVSKSDPKEYEDDETEDGPVYYPMDGGDDGDDDDGDSFGDDADDEDEDEEDEEEEEEHLALTDSTVVIPTDELVSPPEGTKPVKRLLAMPTPSSSPLALLLPPSAEEHLARCTAPNALPLPPPLLMPPPVDRRDDIPETEMPPRKRLCLSTLGSRDTWVDPTKIVHEIASMTVREVNTRVTELTELHKYDTQDLYALLEDAQGSRTRISQRVAIDSQWVDLLMEDRIAHQETIHIVEDEAYVAREAWAHST